MSDSNRVEFANSLRGIASLCVLVAHYFGVFWLGREVVGVIIFATPLPAEIPAPSFVYWLHSSILFNWGSFGVALFFLISGFVIPFSLENGTGPAFAINRFLRIIPTYIVGFTLTLCALWLSSRYWAQPWPLSLSEVVIHYVPGLRDLLWSRNIDYVVWTLEIEVRFYLLCGLAAAWFRGGSRKVFLIPATLTVSGLLCNGYGPLAPQHGQAVFNFSSSAMYLTFMFIGTVFHYLHKGRLRPQDAIFGICALFAAFCVMWQTGPTAASSHVAWSYGFALFSFSFANAYPSVFRSNPVLVFFADISYPLYVVHGVAGYVILRIFLDLGLPSWLALTFGTSLAIGVAWGLHQLVEAPSNDLGKRLGRHVTEHGLTVDAGQLRNVIDAVRSSRFATATLAVRSWKSKPRRRGRRPDL